MRPRFELKTLKRTLKFALNLHNAKNQRQASHNWSRAVSIRVYFSSLLAEIVFGMRCPSTVKHTVASALKGRDKEVKLYEMHERRGTFQLDRNELDVGELSVYYPRRALSDMEGFDPCVEEGDPPQVSSSA